MGQKLVQDKTKEFSGYMVKVCGKLVDRKQTVLSSQLMRSGTAIGALVAEAQQAETRADFIHKIKLACKEAEETDYCLSVVSNIITVEDQVLEDLQSIKRILNKIIATAKKNQKLEKGVKKYRDKE